MHCRLVGRLLIESVTIIAVVAYLGYLPAGFQHLAAAALMQDTDHIKLTSLSAYDSNHDYVGEIREDNSNKAIFKSGETVFLHANFTNTGNLTSTLYTIVIEVRNGNSSETSAHSSVQTKFAGASDDLAIELYWKPNQKASYTLLVFLLKTEDLNKTFVQPPIASVRLQVA